jgi:hypothetical protein
MTNADRLNAIVARVGPRATYVITTLAGTARRIVVTDPETGDALGATGDTITAAVTALDAKVPGGQVKE